jgi:formylglycine-generating enzyme required for sulfatase activity
MGGNVWEWVVDWYDWHDYDSSQLNNPKGSASGIERVVRGGSFFYVAYDARVDVRFAYRPEHRYDGVGFRCAR